MVNLSIRFHPGVLFSYTVTHVDMILRVENPAGTAIWAEADVSVPDKLSLSPNSVLRKGRVRLGIVGKSEFIEKAVKVYGGSLTNPQIYRLAAVLYVFNKDGIIDSRQEKSFDLRCEMKKEASL
ncbi:hypothetical protein HZC07_01485 [Candidatus Micrarchaeota archaeon]|nr:hypothetical protein [Candidatus Micrarchaeota archaeon]